jgi:NADPH-dependent curcumin reductase CurA
MNLLEDKTLVITGALGALGREVCAVAESQGARVVRLDIVNVGAHGASAVHGALVPVRGLS